MDRYITRKPKSKQSDKTKKTKGVKGAKGARGTKVTKGVKGTKVRKGTKGVKKGSGKGYSETKAKWGEINKRKHQERLGRRVESRTRHSEELRQKNLLRHQARMQRRENTDAKVAAMKIRMSELAKAKRGNFVNKFNTIKSRMNMRRPMTNHVNMG